MSQQSFINTTFEDYISKSSDFINEQFPTDNDYASNSLSIEEYSANNWARFYFYSYAMRREHEFKLIKKNLEDFLNSLK